MRQHGLSTAWEAIVQGASLAQACDAAGMRGAPRGVLVRDVRRLLAGEARLARIASSLRTPELMLAAIRALEGEPAADSELARAGVDVQELRQREARILEYGSPAARLGQRGSVSDEVAAALEGTLGAGTLEFLSASWKAAPLCLRVNQARISRDELRARLETEGIATEPCTWSAVGLRVLGTGPLPMSKAWEEGLYEVQDEASQLVAQVVAPTRSAPVVDACAGSGGKTLALCAQLGTRGRVVALDIGLRRLTELRKRAARAQAFNLLVQEAPRSTDASSPAALDPVLRAIEGRAARVLVDAPCSGLGAMRRKPDVARRVDQAMLDRLPAQQYAIAREALRWLKPDGLLVYATCTPLAAENEGVVARLVSEDGMQALPQREWLPAELHGLSSNLDGTALRLLPHVHAMDGFVIHVLRPRAAAR